MFKCKIRFYIKYKGAYMTRIKKLFFAVGLVSILFFGCSNLNELSNSGGTDTVTALARGLNITSDLQDTHSGYFFSFWWDNRGGTVSMWLNNNGNYNVQWGNLGNEGNFTCGKGWRYGDYWRTINYNCGYWGVGGHSVLAAYGWTRGKDNVLNEYYVIENWGSYRPQDGEWLGTVESDGGTYDVYRIWREGKASIDGEVTNFHQYKSVRRGQRPQGINNTITMKKHFDFWSSKGMNNEGGFDYEIMLTEGYGNQSQGYCDITVW